MGVADDPRPKRGTGTRAFGTPEPQVPGQQPVGPAATPAPVTPAAGSAPPTSGPNQMTVMPDPHGDPMVGQTLVGRYFIQKKLGEGGMGSVYLSTHVALEKQVALKVLHGEFARKPDLIERFLQEAKAASRIRHENVIDITDFGQTEDGMVFFAMEMLAGRDLSEVLGEVKLAGERFPWARTKPIFLQVLSALSAAHHKGIIHRDLKPENIFLIERLGNPDFVKLLDFGIAKLTEVNDEGKKLTKTGMLFGTPEYMSPEQARGEKVDHRVDVYAMGCILFQMISGHVPFEADNFMGILTMHLTQETPLLGPALGEVGAPSELEGIVQKALAKERGDRFDSIDAFMQAILSLNDGLPTYTTTMAIPRMASQGDLSAPVTPVQTPVPAAQTPVPAVQRTQWTGSVKLPDATESMPAIPDRGSNKGLVFGLVGALAIGAGVAAFMLTRGGGEAAAPAAEIAPPPATDPGGPVTDPGVPSMVIVRVESDPPGATITDMGTGKVLGATPQDLTVERGNEPRRFELKLDGYRETIVAAIPNQDRQTLPVAQLVELKKDKRDKPPRDKGDKPPVDKPADPPDKGDPAIKPPDTDVVDKTDKGGKGDKLPGGEKPPAGDPFKNPFENEGSK